MHLETLKKFVPLDKIKVKGGIHPQSTPALLKGSFIVFGNSKKKNDAKTEKKNEQQSKITITKNFYTTRNIIC